jgi:hypothetical protein
MKLLTKELEKKIPPLYSQENNPDPTVVAKFFCPWGSGTWWIIEGEWQTHEEDGDKYQDDYLMFGLCMLFTPQEAELGYVSLNELASVTGPMGLKVERDMYWEPVPLSKVKERLGI